MTNMKCFLFITFLFFSNFIFCQPNTQLHSIKPNWKLGDIKKVHTVTFTNIYIKDSLVNNTEVKSYYSIAVIDTNKHYTLSYSIESNSLDVKTESNISEVDSALAIMTDIIKNIEEETQSFQYEILVDKKTGQALEVKNSDKFLTLIEKATSNVIDKFGNKLGMSSTPIDSIKQKIGSYFKLKGPNILKTMLNEFNYIMGAYSLTFPYNSSISQEALVHDVNTLGEFGDIEFPAFITTSSKKTDESLTIQTDTDYDKEYLLNQFKKKHKSMAELTTSDIYLSEKTEAIFTNATNWIVSQSSIVIFKVKEVKVINETKVSFQ